MKTIIINRFDKSFGPMGSSAGFFLLIGGLFLLYFSFSSIFLVVLGIFLAFTHTSATLDYENKRVRFCNNICGFLKFGKWVDIQPDMTLRLAKNRQIFRSYSRSNRTLDVKTHQYQLLLYSSDKEKIMPLVYSSSISEAKETSKKIAEKLGLEIIH